MKILANKDIRNLFLAVSVIWAASLLLAQGFLWLRYQRLSLCLLFIFLLAAAAIWVVCCSYFKKQNKIMEQAVSQINVYLDGDSNARIECDSEGELYRLFHSVNSLAAVLNAHADNELREKEFLKNTISDISHQLKTPLASLRLYCEMDESFHLSQQLTQIERMERLIQSLLRLERLCADGYEFTYDEQKVASIIRSCWAGLSATFPACTVEVIGNAIIRCDEKWLSEAFTNLLKNACEHMPEGGTVHVRMETTEAAFFCTVEDEGGGASGKDLPHLFERFYRAEGSPSSGVGIGLAIVREIIWRHHGTISAENTAKGLKMTISIPLMKMIRTYS